MNFIKVNVGKLTDLGATFRAQGKSQQASEIAAEVLGLRRNVLGDRHPDTIRSMSKVGLLPSRRYRAGTNVKRFV